MHHWRSSSTKKKHQKRPKGIPPKAAARVVILGLRLLGLLVKKKTPPQRGPQLWETCFLFTHRLLGYPIFLTSHFDSMTMYPMNVFLMYLYNVLRIIKPTQLSWSIFGLQLKTILQKKTSQLGSLLNLK